MDNKLLIYLYKDNNVVRNKDNEYVLTGYDRVRNKLIADFHSEGVHNVDVLVYPKNSGNKVLFRTTLTTIKTCEFTSGDIKITYFYNSEKDINGVAIYTNANLYNKINELVLQTLIDQNRASAAKIFAVEIINDIGFTRTDDEIFSILLYFLEKLIEKEFYEEKIIVKK